MSLFRSPPAPDQPPLGGRSEFELLANPQALDPKNHSLPGGGKNEFPTTLNWNFLVHEPILQLDRQLHSDGLETIAWLPVPQDDA